MKLKTTKRHIAQNSRTLLSAGYCDLQFLFYYKQPFAYSAGVYGWTCDYYDLGNGVILSTGYSPIGQKIDYKLVREYDNKARKLFDNFECDISKKLDNLIYEFVTLATNEVQNA